MMNSFQIFDSQSQWLSYRHKTLFESKEQLDSYQKIRLKYMEKVHQIQLKETNSSHLLPKKINKNQKLMSMVRSGTMSLKSEERRYYWPMNIWANMESHHMWKIERSHKIEEPGNIVWIASTPFPFLNKNETINRNPPISDHPLCSICGPVCCMPLGYHNKTYFFRYNCNERYDQKAWEYNINLALSLKPKLIRCSPSTIEIINHYFKDKFDCPALSSEETLMPHIKSMADSMFTKVIDKMMCWDGGLGWWECHHGRKHVYDEFCLLETINDNLVTTDLNNEAMPFFRYHCGDQGILKQGMCSCGLYGNYFEEFQGKSIEGVLVDDRLISGINISESLSAFLRGGTMVMERQFESFPPLDMRYRIIQKVDQSIHFSYWSEEEMTELQKELLQKVLSWIIYNRDQFIHIAKVSKERLFGKDGERTKSLSIRSEYLRQRRLLL